MLLPNTTTRPASAWARLDLTAAPAEGPVAFGDDLRPQSLLSAYRRGLYPFPAATVEQRFMNEVLYEAEVAAGRVQLLPAAKEPYAVAWCCPDPRPLILLDGSLPGRSLRRRLRAATDWTTTADARFERVVTLCGEGRSERWLTDGLFEGLLHLHRLGYAHSVEVWDGPAGPDGAELIGGTFGVRTGAVFSADSQFTLRSGAGKAAVTDLARRFAAAGGRAVDVQQDSAHVRLLGARPVPRADYLELLRAPHPGGPLPTEALPVSRLADLPEGVS